jgi:hypothetical protein
MAIDINNLDIHPLSDSELHRRFDTWSAVRSEYLDFIFQQRQSDEQDADRIAAEFLQIETTLLMSAASRNSRTMTTPRLSYLVNAPGRRGQNCAMLCPRSQVEELSFGDYAGEFYLSTYIDAEGLPHVADDFWEHVVALSKYEGFEYSDNSSPNVPTPEAKAIRRSGRSEIYKLIRDFALYKICGGDIENIGRLEVRWPIEIEWKTFWGQFEDVFRQFVRINSALYRVRYLEEKRLSKKLRSRINKGIPSEDAN